MGQAKRKGARKEPPKTRPLTGEEALQVALLGTCQITVMQLRGRLSLETNLTARKEREYWLDRMDAAINAIDMTLDGYVNKEFEHKFLKYQKTIESDIGSLLMTYREM